MRRNLCKCLLLLVLFLLPLQVMRAQDDYQYRLEMGAGGGLVAYEGDLTGNILTANENFCAALGYSLQEIQGKHHSMFCEPNYARTAEYADFWKRLAAGEFFSNEFVRYGKGGKEIWIQAAYNPIRDFSGKVYKVVKFATDVSERMSAINSLGAGLRALAARHPIIGEVRGMGVFWALELVADRDSRTPAAPETIGRLKAALLARGLLPFIADNRLHVVPPCVVTPAEVNEGLGIIDAALLEVTG